MNLPVVYLRGTTWWVRLTLHALERRASTGTAFEDLAKSRVALFYECAKYDRHLPLLIGIMEGRISLAEFCTAYHTESIEALRRRASDVCLASHVDRWLRDLRGSSDIQPDTVNEYEWMVRTLMPEGANFFRSEVTPKAIGNWLNGLRHKRTGEPLSTTTRRHYFDALRAFHRWLITEGLASRDLLEGCVVPKLGKARDRVLEYPQMMAALEAVTPGPARVALWGIAGSGMEQQAVQRATGRDVILGQPVLGRTLNGVWAHGSKNGYRSRLVFFREWAWREVQPAVQTTLPTGKLFDCGETIVRREWKAAQLAAKVADESTLLTVHDLRHCYCMMVLLGADAEPRMDLQWCADQLGHGDTTMVQRIYAKFRLRDRLRAVEMLEAQQRYDQAPPAPQLQVMR